MFKKKDVDTGKLRQQFFTNFLRTVAKHIDSWEPREFIMTLPFCQNGTMTEACINGYFFDFFDFPSHVEEFTLEVAVASVEQRKTALPTQVLEAITMARTDELKANMKRNFESRRRKLQLLRDDEVAEFCSLLKHFDDDRDALALVSRFVTTGYFASERLPMPSQLTKAASMRKMPTIVSSSILASAADASVSPSNVLGNSSMFPAPSSQLQRFGLTSKQMAQVLQAFQFNDSRLAAMTSMAAVLLDDLDWAEIFETIYFGWEDAEGQFLECLGCRLES
jgi:hypothetical protein